MSKQSKETSTQHYILMDSKWYITSTHRDWVRKQKGPWAKEMYQSVWSSEGLSRAGYDDVLLNKRNLPAAKVHCVRLKRKKHPIMFFSYKQSNIKGRVYTDGGLLRAICGCTNGVHDSKRLRKKIVKTCTKHNIELDRLAFFREGGGGEESFAKGLHKLYNIIRKKGDYEQEILDPCGHTYGGTYTSTYGDTYTSTDATGRVYFFQEAKFPLQLLPVWGGLWESVALKKKFRTTKELLEWLDLPPITFDYGALLDAVKEE